jgi:hypothetical protein
MTYRQQWWLAPALVIAVAAPAGLALAQQHPEHPKGGAEHPEHPKGESKPSLTKDELAEAVEAYVQKESAKHDGAFVVKDPVEKKDLSLTLKQVHRERLSQVAPGTYFACADFSAADGTTYDLDIFMKGKDKDHMKTTDVTIHKKNGVERYTWYEDNGVWKKKNR